MRVVCLVVSLVMAGCLGTSAPAPAAHGCGPGQTPGPLDDCLAPCAPACPSRAALRVDAPELPLGRAWTYTQKAVYDPAKTITVVVAQKGPEGYLFAGGSEDELALAAVWGSPWFGHRALDLSPSEAEGGPGLLSFPLYDGKTWDVAGRNVTAHVANVTTPSGQELGFVLDAAQGGSIVHAEYAPSVGSFTSYRSEIGGVVWWDIRLVKVEEGHAKWVWFTKGPSLFQDGASVAGAPALPAAAPAGLGTLDVPEGFDAVALSMGATAGRVDARGPDGTGWTFENTGPEAWTAKMLSPATGKWTLTATNATASGWAYGALTAVKWIRP